MGLDERLRRFVRFAAAVGLEVEPFQLLIGRELLGDKREAVITMPRGAGKTSLTGCVAAYLLALQPRMTIVAAASARDQAQHLYRAFERYAQQLPALRRSWTFTRREARTPQGGQLVVISADAEKQMGWDPNLVLIDELGSMRDPSLYESMRSALIKRPEARIRIISTLGGSEDAPMPEMRRRLLEEGAVVRAGAVLKAETRDVAWLEWSVSEGTDLDDVVAIKAANPASWITTERLEEHRRVLHEVAFRRLHCNQLVPGSDAFIAADQWDACAGVAYIPDGSRVVVAIDAGIRRDSTAVCVVRKDEHGVFHARFKLWTPSRGRDVRLEDVEEHIAALCGRYDVGMVVYDPHLFVASAQRLEERGAPMVEVRQNNQQMVPATALLRELVSTGRLRHGGDELARPHALAAMVAETELGIRIRKSVSRARIDACVALAMAVAVADALPAAKVSVYQSRGLIGV